MSDMRFTEAHEWARQEGDEIVVGITQFAQEQLGDIVFVELPDIGAEISAGEEAAVVESVKAAGDLKAPISGTVTAVNEVLVDEPETVNESPETEGWFFKLKASNKDEMASLMDADAYAAFVETQA